jgi:hypothetical protein
MDKIIDRLKESISTFNAVDVSSMQTKKKEEHLYNIECLKKFLAIQEKLSTNKKDDA